ncbi:hypothetical protein [Caenispirillum salinarum]|uniref:hypothetical protein n=1 Tax=Caenispirillum salinarum TaxID=859058 RepID=UPI0038511EF1
MPARKKKNLSKKDRQGLAIIAGIGVVLLALIGVRLAVGDSRAYDPETFCPVDGPTDHLAVLIDRSDSLSRTQAAVVRRRLEAAAADLDAGERLSLFVLSDDDYDLEPLFSKCSPGDGTEANALYQNPALIRRRFEEGFRQPLDMALDEAVEGLAAGTSPIMEMMQVITTLPTFQPEDSARRRLLIVSDMLHNMPYFTQYAPNGADFEAFRRRAGREAPSALLNGVDVQVIYLVRPGFTQFQGREHVEFWERWIAEMGGRLTQTDRVR